MRIRILAMAAMAAWMLPAAPADAQQRLRFAHVYETNESYHTVALWAAQQIQQRTSNRYTMEVFPASALGNEPTINQGLALGTVDLIYTGTSFAGAQYGPLAISGAPYMMRNFAHWQAYRDSELFRELSAGYGQATGHRVLALTYYGERMVTANREIRTPADMRGLKLRVPQAPLYLMFARSVGANATPIAFAEVYLALQQGTVDAQENPLPTIEAKKFYEVQSHIILSSHITESLLTIAGAPLWNRLTPADRQIFEAVFRESAARATDEIRQAEQRLAEEFSRRNCANGRPCVVVRPDREAFRQAAVPLHNDQAAGARWTRQQYDRLQALAPPTN